jgi:DNA-binding response OmpR family regulator
MPKILILEDDPDIAELYRQCLVKAGYDVVGVGADIAGAMAGPSPDVILLDERLGCLSGTRAIPDLRRAFPSARILLATADAAAVEGARASGADEVETKPFSLRRLVRGLSALLAPDGEPRS